MIRSACLAVALLGSTVLPAQALAQGAVAEQQIAQLNLSATGEVRITPDQAQVSAGVVTEARTAAEALRANSQRMQAVFAALNEAGVQARDIQTSQLNVSPIYSQVSSRDGGTRQISGYSAQNTVTALVRGVETVGPAIDALFAAGANSLNGVTFSSSEADAAEAEARRRAVAKLYETRDLYSEAAGFTVTRLLSFSESGGYAPQPVMFSRAMMMEDSVTPVSGGELVVSVTVNGAWEIEG